MEVAVPSSPKMDYFDFNEARSSPHHHYQHDFLSVPTSPERFSDLSLSAPASPRRVAELYRQLNDFFDNDEEERGGGSGVPFEWEEKPGTPKSPNARLHHDDDDDFSFNLSVDVSKDPLFAEELFDKGKIRPLKPSLRLVQVEESNQSPESPRSPRSPSTLAQGKKIIREAFSPKKNKKKLEVDLPAAAVENTRKRVENERWREFTLIPSSSRRPTRSLSPFRVADSWAEEDVNKQPRQQVPNKHSKNPTSSTSSSFSSKTSSSSSRKLSLKDLLLFRSASEGRASDKDYLRKYTAFFRRSSEDAKNANFRSTDGSSGSKPGPRRSRGQVISAHELHYNTNKAASEDLKKKTFLPYKQGILGNWAFNPASR